MLWTSTISEGQGSYFVALLCCVANYFKTQWLKTTINIYYLILLVCQEFRVTKLGGSGSGSLMRVPSGCHMDLW